LEAELLEKGMSTAGKIFAKSNMKISWAGNLPALLHGMLSF
jgi:hypothetical protein